MYVSNEKLLSLKVFYLGRKITKNLQSIVDALKMVDAACEKLERQVSHKQRKRLVFYYLLGSEISRGDEKSIIYRQKAKRVADDIKCMSYYYYMRIKEATSLSKKVDGFSSGVIRSIGAQDDGYQVEVNRFGGVRSITDNASRAVEVDLNRLSPKNRDFLESTNLMKMLKHHGINYP
ncbi:hypothetical protein [Sneathiella litorea]|uniref:Uncharacterized protein n=1 Tax=Sneathiella litorea TaxID=2606216 RepID=A0A6L8W769_9PROT|nr:hypothetical protein [Sneathiella litorea]MZR30936.1 hypothetical protein [Sneathiella litorea]